MTAPPRRPRVPTPEVEVHVSLAEVDTIRREVDGDEDRPHTLAQRAPFRQARSVLDVGRGAVGLGESWARSDYRRRSSATLSKRKDASGATGRL